MHLRIAVPLLAASLLAACASTPESDSPDPQRTVADGPEGTLLRPGEIQEGVLTSEDPTWRQGGAFHLYRFEADAGDRFIIEMESEEFDSYLVVGDKSAGIFSPIVEDDDGGGDYDARIRFVAPENRTYWVLAQAYHEYGSGGYTLSLSEAAAPGPVTAIRLTPGSPVRGDLTEDDALDEYEEKAFDLYTFEGRAGQRYALTMNSSDFDTYVVLGSVQETFEEIARNDDGGASTDSRIVFTAEQSGTYEVQATSFDIGETGAYTIELAELGTAGPAVVGSLSFGSEVEGTLDDNDQISDDGSFYDVYTFNGREGQRVSITMSSDDLDSYLELGEGEDEFYAQHTDDDSGGGIDARIVTTLWRTGEFVVRANSFHADQIGSYVISLAELPESGEVEVRPIQLGQTIEGSLRTSDALLDDDSYYDIYTFRGNAGDRVSITLRSDDFDSYLAFGAWRNNQIDVTHDDDDSGGGLEGLDSQIQLTLPSTGTYAIRANSLGSWDTGDYTISLERQ